MDEQHTPAERSAPWRARMVPGRAPLPVYANDAPLTPAPAAPAPDLTADRAALRELHRPASIARVERAPAERPVPQRDGHAAWAVQRVEQGW